MLQKKKKKGEQPFRTCVGFFKNFAFNIDVDVNNFFWLLVVFDTVTFNQKLAF